MIQIDYREPEPLINSIKALGYPTEVTSLQIGDYIVNGVPIERKSASDFLASMLDGRLDNQLYELSLNYDLSYLVITGNLLLETLTTTISKNAVISKLISISLKVAPSGKQGQVITVQLFDDNDLIQVIKKIYHQTTEPEFRLPAKPKHSPNDDDWKLYVLKSLPGIGEVKAKALIEHFGCLEEIFSATPEELSQVKGINSKLSERLFNLFHEYYKGDQNVV